MTNKGIIAILAGIIALAAGALAAAFIIKKRLDAESDEESFEDFDMIGDDEDFFAEEDYDEAETGSDSIPYTNHIPAVGAEDAE